MVLIPVHMLQRLCVPVLCLFQSDRQKQDESLGLNYAQTMRLIIVPQAFKNVLPALVNEMIVLIKETAIIGYIGEQDLTKAA